MKEIRTPGSVGRRETVKVYVGTAVETTAERSASPRNGKAVPQSHRLGRENLAQLSHLELLCRIMQIKEPSRVEALLDDGLLGLLWKEAEELERQSSRQLAAKLRAAVELVRRIARAQVAPTLRDDGTGLVRYLYLAHSRRHEDITGVLFLNPGGCLFFERILCRGGLSFAALNPLQVLRPALKSAARRILVFHLHAGGPSEFRAAEEAFADRIAAAAALLGLDWMDSWIVGGPTQVFSRKHGHELPRNALSRLSPAAERSGVSERRFLCHGCGRLRAEDALAVLLSDGLPGARAYAAARHLLADCGGVAGLASRRPETLRCPEVSPHALEAAAATIELTRRLGQCTVPRGSEGEGSGKETSHP